MTLNLLIKWEEDHLVFKCKECNSLTENKLSEEGTGVKIKSSCSICSERTEWTIGLKIWEFAHPADKSWPEG